MGARIMKDLPVKFWKKRGHFVINAARVGLSVNHGNFATENEAIAEAEKLKAKFVLGRDVKADEKPKLFSVQDAIDTYTAKQNQSNTKSYHQAQKFNLKLLSKVIYNDLAIGKYQIAYLGRKEDREDFRACIEQAIESEGQSIETMHTRRKHWAKFFNYASGKGWVDANPIEKIKLPKKLPTDDRAPKVQEGFVTWLQTDGLDAYTDAYVEAAKTKLKHGNRNELTIKPLKLELMMLLAMTTGIREGELRALKRRYYFSNRQFIKIRHAVKHGTQDIGLVKTSEGQDREIEVPSEICKMLDDWLQDSPYQNPDDLIFPNTVGNPLRIGDFVQACKPIRAACPFVDEETGKPLHFTWGDLRHVFASNMIHQLEGNWAEVAESMGHTKPEFTKKQYGHYIHNEEKSERKRNAAGAILVNRKGRL
jgi:integrase